jgi:hypothetical protein
MMHVQDDRLQEYIDDVLGGGARDEVERHLSSCAECRESVQQTRALLTALSRLPRGIAPERDLLAGIHTAIDAAAPGGQNAINRTTDRVRTPRPGSGRAFWDRPLRSMRLQLAVAATLLVAATSALTVYALLSRERDSGTTSAAAPALAPEQFHLVEANYIAATTELEAVLRTQLDALPPETARIVEENLRLIDAALAETRAALRGAPGDAVLSDMVVAAYEKKLELLRRAAAAPVIRGGI